MYKRKLSILMAVVLASTSFMGCAKKTDDAAKEASEYVEAVNVEAETENSAENAAAEADTAKFDPGVYESLDWNVEAFSNAVKLTTKGYYGSLNIQAVDDTMYMSIEYNLPHIAELQNEEIPEESGSLIELYSSTDGKFYMNDMVTDAKKPKRIYFNESESESGDDTELSAGIGDSFNLKNMLGEDVSYVGYRNETIIDGKTVDVCNIKFTDNSERIIPCCAYIDRETKTLLKIEKEAESEENFSMIIEPMTGTISEPSWISECVEASDEDAMELFGLIMVMALIISDKDMLGSVSSISDIQTYDVPEEQQEMMNEKLRDKSYWESKIGSYSGFLNVNGQATIYDKDNNEHYFVWDSTLQDFVESDTGISRGVTD